MSPGVEVRAGLQHGEVGLQLGAFVQADGSLNPNDVVAPRELEQEPDQPVNAALMATAEGAHFDYLTLYELDPVVLIKDSGLSHAVVFVNVESPAQDASRYERLNIPSDTKVSSSPSKSTVCKVRSPRGV